MQRKSLYVLLFSLLVLFTTGCTSHPLYNVDDAAIVTGKTEASMDEIKNAVVRAGASLGWSMKPAGAGHLIGTLHLRKHVAVVDIKYNTKTYSIMYKDSVNLNYDGKNIHRNYNGWIQNLNHAIQAQLSAI
jgi:hypothetical protein